MVDVNIVWVLKNSVIGRCFLAEGVAAEKFFVLTSAKRCLAEAGLWVG